MEPKEVVFERTFDAPADKVWQAWTDPELMKQWWGPDNTFIPECEIDLKVGGRFYVVMEDDEGMGEYKGTRWPMEATFTKVEPTTALAYEARAWTEGDEQGREIKQLGEITFTEEDGKTKMVLKATLTSVGPHAGMAVEGMQYGYNQQFDKLAALLQK
jgi:uncharacterized protein YndB with AHSA1/START domain